MSIATKQERKLAAENEEHPFLDGASGLDLSDASVGEKIVQRHIGELDFIERVVNLAGGHRRLVEYVDFARYNEWLEWLDSNELDEDPDPLAKNYERMFSRTWPNGDRVPQYIGDPRAWPRDWPEWNLVTSLGTDGAHHPLIDWDFPFKDENSQWVPHNNNITVVIEEGGSRKLAQISPASDIEHMLVTESSSGNTHIFLGDPVSFTHYQGILNAIPAPSVKRYAQAVAIKGYGSLRVPWCKKDGKA